MKHNPTTGEMSVYECYECGARVEGDHQGVCPECSGEVRNIGVVRE